MVGEVGGNNIALRDGGVSIKRAMSMMLDVGLDYIKIIKTLKKFYKIRTTSNSFIAVYVNSKNLLTRALCSKVLLICMLHLDIIVEC